MKKNICLTVIILSIIIVSSVSFAQQEPTTTEGRKVILNKDGTWEYDEESAITKDKSKTKADPGGVSISQHSTSNKQSNWVPLYENSEVKFNINYPYHSHEMKLNNGMLLRVSTWNGFLKDYVLSFSANKRDTILLGLSRFYKEYDKVDKLIRFEPLRYWSGPYSSTSYISLIGTIEGTNVDALVKLKYFGNDWIFANTVKVVADEFSWESDELNFQRDNSSRDVWEYAYLDFENQEVQDLLWKIVDSDEAIIRFIGKQYYSDFTIPERMKTDIKALMLAIKAIQP